MLCCSPPSPLSLPFRAWKTRTISNLFWIGNTSLKPWLIALPISTWRKLAMGHGKNGVGPIGANGVIQVQCRSIQSPKCVLLLMWVHYTTPPLLFLIIINIIANIITNIIANIITNNIINNNIIFFLLANLKGSKESMSLAAAQVMLPRIWITTVAIKP